MTRRIAKIGVIAMAIGLAVLWAAQWLSSVDDAQLFTISVLACCVAFSALAESDHESVEVPLSTMSVVILVAAVLLGPFWSGLFATVALLTHVRMGSRRPRVWQLATVFGLRGMAALVALRLATDTGSLMVACLAADGIGRAAATFTIDGWRAPRKPSARSLVALWDGAAPSLGSAVLAATVIAAQEVMPMLLLAVLMPTVLLRSVQEISRRNVEMQRHLAIDPLTGVFKRAVFWNRLAEELQSAGAHGAVGVLLIDLDDFKLLNDTVGHVEGDAALMAVAHSLRDAVPQGIVSRYGGEEFAVVVPGTSLPDLERVAEQLRAAGLQALAPWDRSISIGAIAVVGGSSDPRMIVDLADKALYAAKAAGKNRSVVRAEAPPHAATELAA